jgi:hypothetical protein
MSGDAWQRYCTEQDLLDDAVTAELTLAAAALARIRRRPVRPRLRFV